MTDRNHRSDLAEKASLLLLAWQAERPEDAEQLLRRLREIYIDAEVQDAAGRFAAQLQRIPLSAPNRTVREKIRELVSLVEEWDREKASLDSIGENRLAGE